MQQRVWQFFIDVGGTFTDVVAFGGDGRPVTYKLLSTGSIRGEAGPGSTHACIRDRRRIGDPKDIWAGYTLRVPEGPGGTDAAETRVAEFDAQRGLLYVDPPLPTVRDGGAYELQSHEEAPVVAIRFLMGLRLDEPIGPIAVRLGTTRATNALLERKGAKVAFVTTRGFGDVLRIGYQDRPELFQLDIRKRDELATTVVEIDERIGADGEVLVPMDNARVEGQLAMVAASGVDAIAVCLLHAHVNPVHEERIAVLAKRAGFRQVSVSHRVARLERIVSRGDTTVLDAYLSPVIEAYVDAIRRSIPAARFQLMTSSGGLMDAGTASGKDTILSGPAGGVVGCAHVARKAGFAKTIGFDMGGTSTDVSRIDSPPAGFEYQHEAVKAGVRIMTPMLAVETVASGGGSICRFDGQMLAVGPQSAGADPGPACYGKGGPLTVTDMNVCLGRIVPAHFPIPLDCDAIERQLRDLSSSIRTAAGSNLSVRELAAGFVRIANANMAAAIKKISVAKGYDVRAYALTSFGGAGGQHACAVARMLGIRRIAFSPFAGVLSALGIGVAEVKRIGQQSVCEVLDEQSPTRLAPLIETITQDLKASLHEEGITDEKLAKPSCTLDVCYKGQSTSLPVTLGTFAQMHAAFEQQHRQLYGYCHEGREIEARTVCVELATRTAAPDLTVSATGGREPPLPEQTSMTVGGRLRAVPVYLRRHLRTDQQLVGPAIVVEDTSTIVIDEGWRGAVRETGDIVLSDTVDEPSAETLSTEADPIQLELFNRQFSAIAEQMGTTLRRTALSTNVKERLDFSCAIFTPTGDLVVNAPHIPVHLGGMSDCVKALIEDVDGLTPGDVYVTNDPYRGGSHLNDVTVITPIHDASGSEILFFMASRAHHAEIGGTRPGSMPPDSTSLAEEGVLIRAFPLMHNGVPGHEGLRSLLTSAPYPSRTPDENLADIAAQAAANQTGVRELTALMDRCGVDVVHAYMRHIQEAAETKMRDALRQLPDGAYHFADQLDDGTPLELTITIAGDVATLDFGGTGPVLPGNLNANRSIVTSATIYSLRCLIEDDIPLNAGILKPVQIVLPVCLLNPPFQEDPRKCPAVVGGNVETSQRIVDCIFGALQTVAASQGTMNNLLIGDAGFGYYETICGGAGAGPAFDGADAVHTHMTNTRLTDPEVLESRYPVRLIRFSIRRGSGGAGGHCGGNGVIREMLFLRPLEVSILSQRRTMPPYGLRGGQPGAPGHNRLYHKATGESVELAPVAKVSVNAGDCLTIETPGGGGYGSVP